MKELIFSIIWLIISNLFLFLTDASEETPILFFTLIILYDISGIWILEKGIKKVIKNNKTKKYGIKCYGLILDYNQTYRGNHTYKVKIKYINPETNQEEKIKKITEFYPNKYPIGSYIVFKLHQEDIRIEKNICENNIPEDIRKKLNTGKRIPDILCIEYKNNKEYVIIDGVQYKKVEKSKKNINF